MNDPLSQLRDIHMPEPVGWWPPAPGWWLLILLGAATLAALVLLYRHRRRRLAVPRAARRQLERIEADYTGHGDRRRLAAELSALLRRVALSRTAGSEVAGLTGEAWLQWLDEQADMTEFTRGPGRALTKAPYRPAPDYDEQALIGAVREWLERGCAGDRRR